MNSVDGLMCEAAAQNIFPGAQLLVSKAGKVLLNKAYGQANIYAREAVTRTTVFDLASLTKPLATTLALMKLIQKDKLQLDQTLAAILPDFATSSKGDIPIRRLLDHTSGLPDYRPYYLKLRHLLFEHRIQGLRNRLLAEDLTSGIGEITRYSDIGFMILQWVVETLSGVGLKDFVKTEIYDPLGVKDLFYIAHDQFIPDRKYAATEFCSWRQRVLSGQVHDDNAHVMGGVAGHAGLFGSAASVFEVLNELLRNFHGNPSKNLFPPDQVRLFFRKSPGSDRALGFDMPSKTGSSCGNYFSKEATVGHLGFTGTSFWMDLDKQMILILLTNRVHPTRTNESIKVFRPLIHDQVMKEFC